MKELKELEIIECKYCYAAWTVQAAGGREQFSSSIKEFAHRREVDLYHLCGVYHTAGVPFHIHEVDYSRYDQYAPYDGITRDFSDAVCRGVRQGKAVLAAGGYCNYAPAIAGGLQKAVGADKRIGLIWIDAHSDNQIAECSGAPVRLVAVPVSVMAGQTLPHYRRETCGLEFPLKGENMLLCDTRDTYEEEEANMEKAGMIRPGASVFADSGKWREAVEALAARVDAIYLSVDADILKSRYIPAYFDEVSGGHEIDTVMRNIEIVMKTGKVNVFSMFCTNFDRYEQGGEYTALSGMKLIASGLRSWKYMGC